MNSYRITYRLIDGKNKSHSLTLAAQSADQARTRAWRQLMKKTDCAFLIDAIERTHPSLKT